MTPFEPQFELCSNLPVPRLPHNLDGSARACDGVRYLSAQQLAAVSGQPVDRLCQIYREFLEELVPPQASEAERERLLREMIFPELADEQVKYLREICRERGLNPWLNHVWVENRHDARTGKNKLLVLTTIDGFRTIAANTGRYRGQTAPRFQDDAGEWHRGWVGELAHPKACTIGVRVAGERRPTWGVAAWAEYAQYTLGPRGRKIPTDAWDRMPLVMLSKCAEAQAIRKAFPQQCAGIYTREEMMQSTNPRGPSGPAAPHDTPAEAPAWDARHLTPTGCRLRLMELGLRRPDVEQVLRDFSTRYKLLLENNESGFYARVLSEVGTDAGRLAVQESKGA